MAISREAIEAVGLLDEELFAYVEDVDWALRVRAAGLEVVFAPDARAWHRVSASTGGEARSTAHALLRRRATRSRCSSAARRSGGPPPRCEPARRSSPASRRTRSPDRDRRAALRAVRSGYADARAAGWGPPDRAGPVAALKRGDG